jgi:hypothetical protein
MKTVFLFNRLERKPKTDLKLKYFITDRLMKNNEPLIE